jgi:hypothetical protein
VAEAIAAIAALCGRTFRSRRTIFRALHRLPFAIHIRAVIGTFRLRLLLFWLMLLRLIRWLLCGLGERREQDCSEHKSHGESGNKSHSTLAFREKANLIPDCRYFGSLPIYRQPGNASLMLFLDLSSLECGRLRASEVHRQRHTAQRLVRRGKIAGLSPMRFSRVGLSSERPISRLSTSRDSSFQGA